MDSVRTSPAEGRLDDQSRKAAVTLLEENIGLIRSLARRRARLGGLRDATAEEYVACAVARLVWNDCAVLRKYDGRGQLRSFLRTTLMRFLADFRNEQWGRWRSSVAARRLGKKGLALERMVYRDRHSAREAVEALASRNLGSRSDLMRALTRLPRRWHPQVVSLTEAGADCDRLALEEHPLTEDERQRATTERIVREAMMELDTQDEELLRLRYWRGMSIADIARTLRLDQKTLYRRFEAICSRMRSCLEARGMARTE